IPDAKPAGTITSQPTVTAIPSLGPNVSDTATTSVQVIDPRISLTKTPTAPPDQNPGTPGYDVNGGTTVTYTIVATNNGTDPLSSVTISDPGCSPSSGATPTLAPGASFPFTCTRTINNDLTNTARVDAL